jgi:hypothetical protein
MASIRGIERTVSSVPCTASRSCAASSSRAPNTTRRIVSSVSCFMRSSVFTRPLHVLSSDLASSATIGWNARMRSPWKGVWISRRSCRCSSPSSTRIECGPANGRRNSQLCPAGAIAGSSRNSSRTGSGLEKSTIGSSVQ